MKQNTIQQQNKINNQQYYKSMNYKTFYKMKEARHEIYLLWVCLYET